MRQGGRLSFLHDINSDHKQSERGFLRACRSAINDESPATYFNITNQEAACRICRLCFSAISSHFPFICLFFLTVDFLY